MTCNISRQVSIVAGIHANQVILGGARLEVALLLRGVEGSA